MTHKYFCVKIFHFHNSLASFSSGLWEYVVAGFRRGAVDDPPGFDFGAGVFHD